MPTYDYKCHVLAGEFLDDHADKLSPLSSERKSAQDNLAQCIQNEIEQWIREYFHAPPED